MKKAPLAICLLAMLATPAWAVPRGVDGMVRGFGVDISAGGTDTQPDNTTEAQAILAAVNSQLGGIGSGTTGTVTAGPSTYNITTNAAALSPRTDWGGGGGSFSPTQPYPGGLTGDQFIQGATWSMFMPAGTYTMFANSDDGFSITLDGATFSSKFGASTAGATNEIRFEGTTGGANSGGVFTLTEDSIINANALFFEAAGGDFFEIGLAQGDVSPQGFPGPYSIITNNLFESAPGAGDGILLGSAGLFVPEPASIALWVLLGSMGLGYAGWRRRRRKA